MASIRKRFSQVKSCALELLDARCMLAANQFAVIGDYGKGNEDEAAVADLVHQLNPALILTAGDNNYPLGEADTIDAKIGKYYHDYIGNYQGTYGPGSPVNRFFPSLGNTDYDNATEDAQPYLDYFTLPGNERYYDVVHGNVHFWIVDSEPQDPDGNTATSRQAQWLQAGLAASTSAFDVVIYHRATYSSGHHGGNTTMQAWPLKAWGAEAVINGHDHIYERLLVDGLPYFVDGTGGSGLYAFEHHAPVPPPGASQFQYNADFGAMLLTDNGSSLKFEFWSIAGGGTLIDQYTIAATAPVRARQVFYNDSAFDENSPAAGALDDGAIAADKQALLPGATATSANYTSYSRGINGLMIDIAGPLGAVSGADFQFRVGNSSSPATWPLLGVTPSIQVRSNVTPGVDRVTLTWPDGTIRNQWLQVTVKATAATGLPAADVFYFGNAIGDSTNSLGNTLVNSTDEIGARNHVQTFLDPAGIDNAYDFNRDGFVDATDQILARSNSTTLATALKLFTAPSSLQAASASASALLADASLQSDTLSNEDAAAVALVFAEPEDIDFTARVFQASAAVLPRADAVPPAIERSDARRLAVAYSLAGSSVATHRRVALTNTDEFRNAVDEAIGSDPTPHSI